jgi:tRNA(Ile)-lysidine synthase
MLSGGRDSSACWTWPCALLGPERVRALHVNYGLREQADADERCVRCAEQMDSRCACTSSAPRAPGWPGAPGNVQAWARDAALRRRRATGGARGRADRRRSHRRDQVETILYRLAASPGRRALLGMGRRGQADPPAAAAGITASRRRLLRSAGPRLGRGRRATPTSATRAPRAPRTAAGAARVHPAAEANVLRTAALLREETEVLDALVDTRARRPRPSIELGSPQASCPARSAAWSSVWPRTPPAPTCPQAGSRVDRSSSRSGGAAGAPMLHVGGRRAPSSRTACLRWSSARRHERPGEDAAALED